MAKAGASVPHTDGKNATMSRRSYLPSKSAFTRNASSRSEYQWAEASRRSPPPLSRAYRQWRPRLHSAAFAKPAMTMLDFTAVPGSDAFFSAPSLKQDFSPHKKSPDFALPMFHRKSPLPAARFQFS